MKLCTLMVASESKRTKFKKHVWPALDFLSVVTWLYRENISDSTTSASSIGANVSHSGFVSSSLPWISISAAWGGDSAVAFYWMPG